MDDLTTTLTALFADKLGVPAKQLTPESRLVDDLGADSLAVVEIMMALEDQFGIHVSDEEADGIRTVADACRVVAAKVAVAERAAV